MKFKASSVACALLTLLALALLPVLGHAAASGNALERYLGDLKTWSADFRQIVVDATGRKLSDSEGRLLIVRPGKFRWESAPEGSDPGAQLVIADGSNVWFLDRDLEQATVKSMDQALPQSPALLLTGSVDLAAAFEQQAARRDGLDWVDVTPRDARSDFRQASFAFKDGQMVRMVVTDKLGQRSELRFTQVQKNVNVDPALMQFTLPPGVDLIGTPEAVR